LHPKIPSVILWGKIWRPRSPRPRMIAGQLCDGEIACEENPPPGGKGLYKPGKVGKIYGRCRAKPLVWRGNQGIVQGRGGTNKGGLHSPISQNKTTRKTPVTSTPKKNGNADDVILSSWTRGTFARKMRSSASNRSTASVRKSSIKNYFTTNT